MKTPALPAAIALSLALGLMAAPAHAQQARSFVSGLGNDATAPNCTRTAPCRTFQAAHDSTFANGEITILDPGSYGSLTINRNISIINDGVGEAGVLVSGGGTGITINAATINIGGGSGTSAVTLRGLSIKGIGFGGGNGIVFNNGKALNVENCTIRNLDTLGNGIVFRPNAASALTVTNTVLSDNSVNGILVDPIGAAAATGVLNGVGLYNNGFAGLNVIGQDSTGTILIQAINSTAANNGTPGNGAGFLVQSDTGKAIAALSLFRSVANNNPSNGVEAFGANATAVVGQSMIQGNASGWVAPSGAAILSYGDNEILLNGSNQGPAPRTDGFLGRGQVALTTR
jgi:hypothetical protein